MMLLPLLVLLFTVCVSNAQNHKIGVKLCKGMCMERSSCERVQYDPRTLTCQLLSRSTEQQMEKGYIRFPKGKHIPFTGVCSLQTCPTNTTGVCNAKNCHQNYGYLSPVVKASTHSPDRPANILNKSCKRTTDCGSINFLCVRQRCQCAVRFSFNPADNTCVKRCRRCSREYCCSSSGCK